jgi:hypothetical protein
MAGNLHYQLRRNTGQGDGTVRRESLNLLKSLKERTTAKPSQQGGKLKAKVPAEGSRKEGESDE